MSLASPNMELFPVAPLSSTVNPAAAPQVVAVVEERLQEEATMVAGRGPG